MLNFDVASCPAPCAADLPSTEITSAGFGLPSASQVMVTSSLAAPQCLLYFSILKMSNQSTGAKSRTIQGKEYRIFG